MRQFRKNEVVPLSEIDFLRRDLCKGAIAGAALAVLPACSGSGGERVGTGPFGDNTQDPTGTGPGNNNGGGNPDMATGNQQGNPVVDMAQSQQQQPQPDLSQPVMTQSNCPGSATDSGQQPSSVAVNAAVYLGDQLAIFLCRDSGGLFALSSVCTHAGCTVELRNGGFYCPCHRARFSYNGDEQTNISNGPLVHYPLCKMANGNVGVDPNSNVPETQRYNF